MPWHKQLVTFVPLILQGPESGYKILLITQCLCLTQEEGALHRNLINDAGAGLSKVEALKISSE